MERVKPKVFLIGGSCIDEQGIADYFDHIGTDFDFDGCTHCEALVEFYGRLCYRSWEPGLNANVTKVREGNELYLRNIIESKHGSVLEHPVTHWVFADVSRVFTHELVRHRVGTAFSQESLRYVRLTDLGLWLPREIEQDPAVVALFEQTFEDLETLQYTLAAMLDLDKKPFREKKKLTSAMRRVAPIGLATTIGVTMNFRALRHIAELRSSTHAEEEIRVVVDQVMSFAVKRWPNLFQDFTRTGNGEWVPEYSKI